MKYPNDAWTIPDFVYLTKDNSTLHSLLWKLAFEDETAIKRLCEECGWNGGTIHQVEDEILRRKDKIRDENPETYSKILSGKMQVQTSKFTL